MKPKTLFQKDVARVQNTLRPVTHAQLNWGIKNCFTPIGFYTKNKAACLECGHQWQQKPNAIAPIEDCHCPGCHTQLKMTHTRKQNHEEAAYFAILTTRKGYQIVRMIFITKYCKAGQPAHVVTSEVMQHWIDNKGKWALYSKTVSSMTGYYDSWSLQSELELRDHTMNGAVLRSAIVPDKIYPAQRILPEITRNGFVGQFFDYSPSIFFRQLLSNNRVETLLKAKQISMLRYLLDHDSYDDPIGKYWKSIRICIRNGYQIKNATTWIDYINLLDGFNKDLLSPHYVCPVDLKASHDRLVAKRRAIQERERSEQSRRDIEESQKLYEQLKSNFFGLSFTDGHLTVKVLESVQEFMQEGDLLKHCLFVGQYYKKHDSLLMSARVNDQPIETVELSLSSLKILQSRGYGNKATEHHARIIELVTQNIPAISERLALQA